MKVLPGEEKVLRVKIHNSSEEAITVNVEINDGTTNNNGITSYQKVEKRDSSLQVGFSDFTTTATPSVVVQGKEEIEVSFDMSVPTEPFEGEILGGFRFTSDKTNKKDADTQTAVANTIAYTVGVVLKEKDEKVAPNMAFNKVVKEQRNYRNYISAELQNTAPRIIKKLEVHAQVYEKGKQKLFYEASSSEMRMAPNSTFLYGVSLEDQPFRAGSYTMKIKGTADGEAFAFEQDFKIAKKEAAKLNENAVFVSEQGGYSWFTKGLILLSCILLGYVLYVFMKNKRRHRDEK